MKPLNMQIEFTNCCNYRCALCPQSIYKHPNPTRNVYDRPRGYMSPEIFELARSNAEKYARHVTLGFFGEQQMHPKFDDMVDDLSGLRQELRLFSNWSLVTTRTFETLKKVNSVRISLDTLNSVVYSCLCPGAQVLDLDGECQKGRLDTVVSKIRAWLSLPDHSRTHITHVVSSANKGEQIDFLRYWVPHLSHRDQVTIKSVVSYGGVMFDSHMTTHGCPTRRKGGRLTIAWDGECSLCNLDVNMALSIGNLLDTPDVQEMLQGERAQKVRRAMKERRSICENCFDANNHQHTKCYRGTGE